MYLLAGLGNPGPEYIHTRHNIGFRVIDSWCKRLGVRLTGRRFQSRNTHTTFHDKEILLLRPQTFMNLSGKSIKACVDTLNLEPEDIFVIHDDVDLPLGRIKVVRGGGAGGHKGVLSIIAYLGTNAFPRLKMGIGRPRYGESIEDFVLSPFCDDETGFIEKAVEVGVRACELFVTEGVDSAMNQIN